MSVDGSLNPAADECVYLQNSRKYPGAAPWSDLYISKQIINSTLRGTAWEPVQTITEERCNVVIFSPKRGYLHAQTHEPFNRCIIYRSVYHDLWLHQSINKSVSRFSCFTIWPYTFQSSENCNCSCFSSLALFELRLYMLFDYNYGPNRLMTKKYIYIYDKTIKSSRFNCV